MHPEPKIQVHDKVSIKHNVYCWIRLSVFQHFMTAAGFCCKWVDMMMLNKRKVLTAKAFYARAMLGWLCLLPLLGLCHYFAQHVAQLDNMLLRGLLYVLMAAYGEVFKPVYFIPVYAFYRYCHTASMRPVSRPQFYGRVVAYYLLLLGGLPVLLFAGGMLQYSVFYFFLVFVCLTLTMHFCQYVIPGYARYIRLSGR